MSRASNSPTELPQVRAGMVVIHSRGSRGPEWLARARCTSNTRNGFKRPAPTIQETRIVTPRPGLQDDIREQTPMSFLDPPAMLSATVRYFETTNICAFAKRLSRGLRWGHNERWSKQENKRPGFASYATFWPQVIAAGMSDRNATQISYIEWFCQH